MPTHHQPAQFSIDARTPLHKGKACIACRRRKIASRKCDGVRVVCGPCSKYPTGHEDCEYSEDGPTLSQVLEDEIARVQRRIEELEGHGECSSSSKSVSRLSAASERTPKPPRPPVLSYFYSQESAIMSTAVKSLQMELPFVVLQGLVHNFLHNAPAFGFFLPVAPFHDAILSSSTTNHDHFPPVLMNVLYLWGIHLAHDTRLAPYEPVFLAHALRSTSHPDFGSHLGGLLHAIQAAVLLAHYFVRTARWVEARYQIGVAVALALGGGLHRVCGSSEDDGMLDVNLGPEEGECERIDALWAVLNLNNCWASAGGAASNVSYSDEAGVRIDTPWPREVDGYLESPRALPRRSEGTVRTFLSGLPDDATSDAALLAKATILYAEASRMGAHYRATGVSPKYAASLDQLLDALKSGLPPVQSRRMLVVHMLCHGATIQLHNSMTKEYLASRARCLVAARAVVDILLKTAILELGVLDPILAPLWTSVCLVFLAEIARQDAGNEGRAIGVLTESLDIVVAAMQVSAPGWPLMTAQLDVVRQAYEGALNKAIKMEFYSQ
ncbi:hypothetical protein C8R46DRAFT_1219378 [Mycena filopes]|nr:hypothetical protein C8R46DRAFT_1219378 [Mycena filopes]